VKKFQQVLNVLVAVVVIACAAPAVKTIGDTEDMIMAGGKSGEVSVPQGVAVQVPKPTQSPVAPILTTQDQSVVIGHQEVATSDDAVTLRFTVALKEGQEFPKEGVRLEADLAALGLPQGAPIRLYRVRDDQFGQPELIDTGQQARTTQGLPFAHIVLPTTGNFLLALKERFPFVDDVIEAIPELDADKYGIFPISGSGEIGLTAVAEIAPQGPPIVMVGSYPATIATWTRDETFPVRVNVFIHHGSGSENRSDPYSFSEWVKYDSARSPRRKELADVVRGYYLDRWNTRLGPDSGASTFNINRRIRFDSGTPRIHGCHSAGCNEATSAWLSDAMGRYNDLGRIELSPARGGSQYETPDLIYATIAKLHLSPFMSLAYLLYLRDMGELSFSSQRTAPIASLLVGKPQTLLNENGRSLTWDGRSVGIPNTTYPWFALGDISFPFLRKRISETIKYRTTPCHDGVPANLRYTDLRTGECFYNYAELLDTYEERLGNEAIGSRDVIAAYVPTVDPETVKKAEKTVLSPQALRYAIPRSKDKQFKEKFERDALPLGCFLIARSPSVVPSDPLPNENLLCDCAVPVAQQLRLKNGRSILRTGSTYTNFGIDEGAVQERLPATVRKFKAVKMNHADVATGSPEVWDLMDQWLLERIAPWRDEENNLVLKDEDRRIMKEVFIPAGGRDWIEFDYDAGLRRYVRRKAYSFYGTGSFRYLQDPLGTKQKNRVRVTANGSTIIGLEGWKVSRGEYVEYATTSESWTINRDFIRRGGIWHLVRLKDE
jgi:hypothetical protein